MVDGEILYDFDVWVFLFWGVFVIDCVVVVGDCDWCF